MTAYSLGFLMFWLVCAGACLMTYTMLPADVKKAMDDLRVEQAEWTGQYVDGHVAEAVDELVEMTEVDEAQAKYLFAYAKKMAEDSPELAELLEQLLGHLEVHLEAELLLHLLEDTLVALSVSLTSLYVCVRLEAKAKLCVQRQV
mgnify:CR=1 FL=1